MSDETNTGTSPESINIPKYRLDEEIARRKQLEEQLQFQNQLLQRSLPNAQPQKRVEPKYMMELREQNPQAYMALKEQDRQLKQLTAAQFDTAEMLDRKSLVEEFGDEAKKKLDEVERHLQELRNRGNFSYNRAQLFLHLKGLEAVKTPKVVQPAVNPAIQEALDAPPSNVKAVDTLRSGSVQSQAGAPKTLEQLEAELENVEF